MVSARAFNIFLNDKINTKVINNVFNNLVKYFKQQNYDIDVDDRLRMIMIKNIDKKRNDRAKLKHGEEVKPNEN